MKIESHAKEYGFNIIMVKAQDLRTCYSQNTPNRSMKPFYKNNNLLMINSPHFDFATCYFKKGLNWLMKNYLKTSYCRMRNLLKGTEKFPFKFVKLCESIKNGYLRKRHKRDWIIMFEEPFAKSRYSRNVSNDVPEIWSGHHRAGALMALNIYIVPIIIAKDRFPGKKKCNKKMDKICL